MSPMGYLSWKRVLCPSIDRRLILGRPATVFVSLTAFLTA